MTTHSAAMQTMTRSQSSATTGPWGISITDQRATARIAKDGILGLGESYIDGQWETDDIDRVMAKVFTSKLPSTSFALKAKLNLARLEKRFRNQQARRAFHIGVKHYDLSNTLFRAMLDESMTYTSGYWANANILNEAQTAKLDLACRKLNLQPGQTVLDIGCGWGNFAKHAAKQYGCRVIGLTVSKEQAAYAREQCADLPVDIRLQDYREFDKQVDHVVSIEMIEAVGSKNIPVFYQTVDRSLRDGGKFVLQVISGDTFSKTSDERLDQYMLWLVKYIFPDGHLPRHEELLPPSDTSLRIEDWQRYVDDYPKTLMAWSENFEKHWPTLSAEFDEQFYRRWKFYLHGCAAAFQADRVQVYQLVYSKGGQLERHEPIR